MVGEVLYEHVSYGKQRQFDAFGDASESFNHASSLYTARLRFVFGAGRIL